MFWKSVLLRCCVVMLIGTVQVFSQDGRGMLTGFVKCGEIGNDHCQLKDVKVALLPIRNWSKTTNEQVTQPDDNGQYKFVASFGEYWLKITSPGYENYQTRFYLPSSSKLHWGTLLQKSDIAKFDGSWAFEEIKYGRLFSLAVTLKQTANGLEGEYQNVSSKESIGNILRSKINGNTATIEIDCDWGGSGTVKLTLLKGGRMRWQVIKRDTRNGEFIVLLNVILKKQS